MLFFRVLPGCRKIVEFRQLENLPSKLGKFSTKLAEQLCILAVSHGKIETIAAVSWFPTAMGVVRRKIISKTYDYILT